VGSIDALSGCPYSLPDDADIDSELEKIVNREARIRERLQSIGQELAAGGQLIEVQSTQRTREIFESNALEGLGPSLSRTADILSSPVAAQVSNDVGKLHESMFVQALREDPHLSDVVTLHGAKILAENLLSSWKAGYPLTETNIRELHSLVCAQESYKGRYKRYHVRISGQGAHEPLLPTDTPAAMAHLVKWLNSSEKSLPSSLFAAIVHAWLTHIHPFEDGNGRVARILANLILNREGLPPAIVMHNSQRAPYLDALRHSDSGGDILPLAGIFLRTMNRFAIDISKPRFLRRLLADEIAREAAGPFAGWQQSFADFRGRLIGELQVNRLEVEQIDNIDASSFGLLTSENASGATWLMRVKTERLHVLLWIGYSTSRINSRIDSSVRYPSIFFSVPNSTFRAKPYRLARRDEVGGLAEVCLVPDIRPRIAMIVDDTLRATTLTRGATEVAIRIRQGIDNMRRELAQEENRDPHGV
jgi:Fic family protein